MPKNDRKKNAREVCDNYGQNETPGLLPISLGLKVQDSFQIVQRKGRCPVGFCSKLSSAPFYAFFSGRRSLLGHAIGISSHPHNNLFRGQLSEPYWKAGIPVFRNDRQTESKQYSSQDRLRH